MRIAGADRAIGNLVKWAAKDDWAHYREQVFADHLDFIRERFDMTDDEVVDLLGDDFVMLYGVVLEDFFTARFGDDGELNVIEDYLKRRGWREKVPAKQYLKAIRDSVMSLYEVVDLDPGKNMTVRDMIRGGDPITVTEKMGSQTSARWDRIAARLVTVGGKPFFTGGMLLMSYNTTNEILPVFEEMAKSFRTKLRKPAREQDEVPEINSHKLRATLLESVGPRLFTQAWLIDALGRIQAPLPEMHNTDGDKILFSEVRFPSLGGVEQITAVIDGIENLERNAPDGPSWTWHGKGSPSQRMSAKRHEGVTFQSRDESGRTSLGQIEFGNGTLLLSTNSRERAERGRDLLASHLGDLVGVPLISYEEVERMLNKTPEPRATDEEEVPPEVAAEILRSYLDGHYRQTLDDQLPILDGKTPRQAVKSKKGRAQVIEWLKYLENSEARRSTADGQAPYDMTWMWQELKLEGER